MTASRLHRSRGLKAKPMQTKQLPFKHEEIMFYGTVWLRWIKAGDPRKPRLQRAHLSVRIHRNGSAFCGHILTNITVSWVATRHHQVKVNICLASDTQANSLLLAVRDNFRNAQWQTIKQTYFLTYLEWCHDQSLVLVQVLRCLD